MNEPLKYRKMFTYALETTPNNKRTNKIKDRWERPKNHQKYVLGTDCSNASRRRDQCISENKKRGVRQGCVLSPDLFSLYSEIIMRNIEGQPGIRVGGHNINNLRYADDTVLISENEKDLQQLLNIVGSKSKKKGLELNSKKTEVMVISRKEEPPLINITINGIKLNQRDHFKYLGALVSSDGRNNTEISAKIAQAKMMFQKMKTVLTNSHISIQTRKRTLECYIEPILMYGCEAWTISR